MLREVLRLLGVDLEQKLAEIRGQVEAFRAKATHQITQQVKETGLMIGFAFAGAIAAVATFVIVLVALYRLVDVYEGPFAALAAVGVITALLAAAMFMFASGQGGRKRTSVAAQRPLAAPPRPPPSSPPQPALSAALPPLPPNASLLDVLTHRFSTRVAGASDEALDAVVHIMRTGSKSVLFGTLGVVALVGVLLGRRHR